MFSLIIELAFVTFGYFFFFGMVQLQDTDIRTEARMDSEFREALKLELVCSESNVVMSFEQFLFPEFNTYKFNE